MMPPPPPPPVCHSVGLLLLYGALDGHPFFPSHVASGRCCLSAAAAGAPAGVVSAFAGPSRWCVGGCAGCCPPPPPPPPSCAARPSDSLDPHELYLCRHPRRRLHRPGVAGAAPPGAGPCGAPAARRAHARDSISLLARSVRHATAAISVPRRGPWACLRLFQARVMCAWAMRCCSTARRVRRAWASGRAPDEAVEGGDERAEAVGAGGFASGRACEGAGAARGPAATPTPWCIYRHTSSPTSTTHIQTHVYFDAHAKCWLPNSCGWAPNGACEGTFARRVPGAPGVPGIPINVPAIDLNALPPNTTPSSSPGTLSTNDTRSPVDRV